MKWHTYQGNLIGPNHPYGLPYNKGELMKVKVFVLLTVGVAAGLLARTVFRTRLHDYLVQRGIVQSSSPEGRFS